MAQSIRSRGVMVFPVRSFTRSPVGGPRLLHAAFRNPDALPQFSQPRQGGGWRRVVAGAGPRHGRRGCNNTVRDHSADRSRKPHRIRGKSAAGEPLRPEPPSVSPGGAGQRQPIPGSLGSVRCGDLLRVAKPEPRRRQRRGSVLAPATNPTLTPLGDSGMIDRGLAPAAQMMSLYSGRSSKKDDFRGSMTCLRTAIHMYPSEQPQG